MSHKASCWLAEIPAGELSGSQFKVLFHLCDAHNSKRDPETACFPSQERLRAATGLSNGGLNNALNDLEKAGLIRRRRGRNADGTQRPTFYILGCDFAEAQEPTPDSGDGTVSTFGASPSPLSGVSRLHSGGDEPVKEPVKEPSRARPQAQAHARAHAREERASAPAGRGGAAVGLAEKQRALSDGRAWDHAEFMAAWLKSDRPPPPSAVSNALRDELLARGLVDEALLRTRQIY